MFIPPFFGANFTDVFRDFTGSRIKDQGSRIRWSLENALDFKKKSLQRLLRAIEKTANSRDRRVSRETLRKLQAKNEKQEDSVSLGYPLQCTGSELGPRNPRTCPLNHVITQESKNSKSCIALLRKDSHFALRTRLATQTYRS